MPEQPQILHYLLITFPFLLYELSTAELILAYLMLQGYTNWAGLKQ